jgi:3-oxoacyl-[acyl-carrier protein] reductase
MDLGIRGRVAIVTGGTRGMGRSTANFLAADGAKVALFARTVQALEETAAELRSRTGADVLTVAGDQRNPADVARLVSTVKEKWGGPDILILITGNSPAPTREVLKETERARWEQAFETNLMAAVNVVSAVAPLMVERKWGRIVCINSATVKQPLPEHGLSTVFRSGLQGYLKHLANENARHGVTVNSVCPSSVGTERFLKRPDAAERAKDVPMGRLGKPEECAAAAAFLCSELAGYITGGIVQVDGGKTLSLT